MKNMLRVGQVTVPKLGKVGVYRKKGLAYQAFELGEKE